MTMLRQVFFGTLKEPHHEGTRSSDITPREIATLAPIMALCLLLGVYPQPVLNSVKPDIDVVANILKDAGQTVLPTPQASDGGGDC